MISVDSSSNRSSVVGIVAAVALGGAAAWWWFGGTSGAGVQEPAAASSAASVANAAPASSDAVVEPERHVADNREAEVGVRLPELPDESASAVDDGLRQVLIAKGGGEKEVERVTAFLEFQRQFQRYQDIIVDPSKVSQKAPLAGKLFAMLPERVKRGELSQPEGLLLCSLLLEALEPDENRRSDRLSQCSDTLTAVAPPVDTEQQAHDADCHLEFRRRQNAVVAEYQAAPAKDRNPAKLASDLDAARKAVYESPSCGHP